MNNLVFLLGIVREASFMVLLDYQNSGTERREEASIRVPTLSTFT